MLSTADGEHPDFTNVRKSVQYIPDFSLSDVAKKVHFYCAKFSMIGKPFLSFLHDDIGGKVVYRVIEDIKVHKASGRWLYGLYLLFLIML